MGTHDDEAVSSRSKRSRQHETVEEDVLNQMGYDGEIDDMLRIRLREAGTNEEIFTYVAWIRAFNINELIYAELCHKFSSTYEFNEVCADDELQTKKIIKFRLGGRAHSLTLLEFARRLGLYQAVELDEVGFNVYFEGGLRSDDHFNAHDYWLSISREENLGLSRSHTSTIRNLIFRVIHKMITYGLYQRMTRYDKVQKNDMWLLSMFDAKHQNGYANVASLIARWMKRKGAGTQKENLDTITLRDLIDSKGKLILKDPQPGVPRVGIPRPPRASMQDLYNRIGRMEIRQEAIERMEYRQSYHWDRPIRRIQQGIYGVSVPALTTKERRSICRIQKKSIRRIGNIKVNLDNSANKFLIPLDSWTSGLLEYKSPLSVLLEKQDPRAVYDSKETLQLAQELGDLKGKSQDTPFVSNTLDPLSQKLEKENVELEFQVSEQKDTTKGTSVNTQFCKQSILEKLPSSSRLKLYAVTPFLKSKGLPKIDNTHALSKPVTSNSVPTPQESKVMNNDKMIAPGMFRINPFKPTREEKYVPNKVRASVRTHPTTVSQPHVITKKDVNSDSNGLSSTGVDNIAKTRRLQPWSNTKNDRVPSASKSSCTKNKEVEVEEHPRNLLLSKNKKHMSYEYNH
ncbi:hypothetical protein Tco_0273646, partial [Tanacetum coccineum]